MVDLVAVILGSNLNEFRVKTLLAARILVLTDEKTGEKPEER